MFKRLLAAGVLGVVSLGIAQVAMLSSSPADLVDSDHPEPAAPLAQAPGETAAWPAKAGNTTSAAMAEAMGACEADVVDEASATPMIDGCLMVAALTDDEALRSDALQHAADALRPMDPEAADSTLMLAAGIGSGRALLAYGAAPTSEASDALLRREALLAAEAIGVPGAAQALHAYRRHFDGQALARPEVLVALVEGRGDQVGVGVEDDRYLVGLAEALVRSCPWQGPMWDGVGFRKSLETFAAPLRSSAQSRLLNTVGSSIGSVASATGQLIGRLWDGQAYSEAGGEFLRDVRTAHRRLNTAASRGSETGARDGVRLAELQGCASADGLRLAKGLRAVFEQRVIKQQQAHTTEGG